MARMQPPPSGVTVRMYRQRGLGDCFLLALPGTDGDARYVLVDCGIFFATSGGAARMKEIAKDIKEATGAHIHVLVATHEHYDHLSGFGFAASRKIFEQIEVDQVWLAWTEDPDHTLAGKLRAERALALQALRAAVTRLRAAGDPRADRIDQVLGFFRSDLGATSVASQMELVRTHWGRPRFLRPGEPPLTIPDVDGGRFYVLGPPEDEGLLKRSNPSTVHSEVYEDDVALNADTAYYAAVLALAEGGDKSGQPTEALATAERLEDPAMPFDSSHRIAFQGKAPPSQEEDFFRQMYGWKDAKDHGPAWRRIDTDWLRTAEQLALQLDNHTNNTSLALALELVPSGGVILLPADAQVGNWISWHDLEWEDGDGATVKGADLLRRTVLYKVGHHGSHNATLRELGLELMESTDLVAVIPVDGDQAKQKEWRMPFEPLYARLEEKTKGRIIRADTGLPREKPEAMTTDEWEEFRDHTGEDASAAALWVEYTVSC